MNKFLGFILLVFSVTSFAASGHGGGLTEEVKDFIFLQIMNFIVFAGVLIYLSKSKVAPTFKQKREDFIAQSQAAEKKLAKSLEELNSYKQKIVELESSYDSEVLKAQQSAETRYKDSISKAKENILRLDRDLESQIKAYKRSRAIELRDKIMSESVDQLKSELNEKIDENLLKQIQKSFVNSVEARL